jgi:hypothetical protein
MQRDVRFAPSRHVDFERGENMCIGIRRLQLCLGLSTLFLSLLPADAATFTATDCSSAAVQSAINSAGTSDTVQVPAGTCTWGSGAVTIPASKRLTLRGAGAGSTVINGAGNQVLRLTTSGSRVTGFTFNSATVVADGDDWRIDQNLFTATSTFFDSIFIFGDRANTHPRGVIDHNEFRGGARVNVIGWSNLAAHAIWSQPLGLGAESGQKVFIEDNTFNYAQYSGVFDTNYGGRFVFRHNTVTNGYVEVHSLQQGRASRSWEVYNNTFAQGGANVWTPFFVRGGTGVIYGNTITGTWGTPTITLDNVRSAFPGYNYGMCNGTSPADGNQISNGWPCRDQIGRGTDTALWTSQNPYPPQASDPAYFWNNTAPGGGPLGIYIHNGSNAWIVSGRDYFNGTQRPGYVPYPYPHPLTQGGGSGPPAPTNLTVR